MGSGAFGAVCAAVHKTHNKKVAVKFRLKANKEEMPSFHKEAVIMRDLALERFFPRLKEYKNTYSLEFVVMDRLGPNLEVLFRECGKKLSLKTVAMLAIQMLERVEILHRYGLIHRDIKPANFTVGSERHPEAVYMIDFGLAKRYVEKDGTLN